MQHEIGILGFCFGVLDSNFGKFRFELHINLVIYRADAYKITYIIDECIRSNIPNKNLEGYERTFRVRVHLIYFMQLAHKGIRVSGPCLPSPYETADSHT
jgi:hypothetical protein